MAVLPCRRCARPVEVGIGTCPYCGRVNPHQEETAPHGFLILLASLRHRHARRVLLAFAGMVLLLVVVSVAKGAMRRRAAPDCGSEPVTTQVAAILHENAVDGLPKALAASVFTVDRFVLASGIDADGGSSPRARACEGALHLALDSATLALTVQIVDGRIPLAARETESVVRHWRRATEQLEIPVKYGVERAPEGAADLSVDEASAIEVRRIVELLARVVGSRPSRATPQD